MVQKEPYQRGAGENEFYPDIQLGARSTKGGHFEKAGGGP